MKSYASVDDYLRGGVSPLVGEIRQHGDQHIESQLRNAINDAFTPNYYAFNLAFINLNINYASAIAFLLGITIMILSYVVQLSTQKREVRR